MNISPKKYIILSLFAHPHAWVYDDNFFFLLTIPLSVYTSL